MLVDVKQKELDLAEERFLTNIFGSTTPSTEVQWLLRFMDIDINDMIQNFEEMVKPLMTNNGLVDAKRLKSLVGRKFPLIASMIPASDFRLSTVADKVSKMIGKVMKGGGNRWSV